MSERREPKYEDRYCAFVDILGFRGIVQKLRGAPDGYKQVRDALQRVHHPNPSQFGMKQTSFPDFRVQSISDAVALSAEANMYGLAAIMLSISSLGLDLLCQGYLIRGGIVRGMLYHDDDMVFGDALVRAYDLESNVARFPRVMIERSIAESINGTNGGLLGQVLRHMVRQSDDGPFHLHFLHHVHSVSMEVMNRQRSKDDPLAVQYDSIDGVLRRLYTEAADDPRHFEKVAWFVNYWNKTVARGDPDYLHQITGPGLKREKYSWS